MSEAWPPQLKEWVAKCLGQMTDSNRDEVQAELKQVIGEAFSKKTLWTTDWNGMQLQSLMPKPPPQFQAPVKRKFEEKPTQSKKKKSNSKANASYSAAVDADEMAALNRRAERFQREHDLERMKSIRGGSSTQVNHAHSHLLSRINNNSRSASPSAWGSNNDGVDQSMDWNRYNIVGTSQQVFKDYLRLTTEPDPKDIRPYRVLEKTLVELKKRWRQNNDYPWICNQFKSIRQDLTVQRIKNEFTVQVYEIHARMALEAGDMVEYNQCQHMLKDLYAIGIPGCTDEFTAYRILMLLHGRNRSDLNLLVGRLSGKQKVSSAIKHALEVQRALSTNNYHAFFEYYSNAPNMGAYIMDHFVDRERARALMIMSKAYHQLPLTFIRDELTFENIAQVDKFLADHNSAFHQNPDAADEQKVLDCKSAQAPLAQAYEEKYRKAIIKGAI